MAAVGSKKRPGTRICQATADRGETDCWVADSPRNPRASSKARRAGDISHDSSSRSSSVDGHILLRTADTELQMHEVASTPIQTTYAAAIREVLGKRALPKEEIIKAVLERHAEFFPSKAYETVKAGLHTTFSNQAKHKDPKIREWERQLLGDGSKAVTVWARAEIDLQAGVESSADDRASALDGTADGINTPSMTAPRIGTPLGNPVPGRRDSETGPTGHARESAHAPVSVLWRAGASREDSQQERVPHHWTSGQSPPNLDSDATQSVAQTIQASLNAGSDGEVTVGTVAASSDLQILEWGRSVGRIKELTSQLEEMRAESTQLSKREQGLQADKEELLARQTQLDKEIQEARRQLDVSTEEATKIEDEVKRKTMELLG